MRSPSQLEFTIALQHLLGIATGLILYAAVRRLGAPVWAGVLAAAAVLLSLDQIFLEHAVMNETVFTFLFALALYAAVRALDPRAPAGRSARPAARLDRRRGWRRSRCRRGCVPSPCR